MGLRGTIPLHLGNLSFLVRLNIGNNSFHGYLPKELAQLRRLKYIDIELNKFSGEIPPWLRAFPKLQTLYLNNNSFIGHIREEIGNLHDLRNLDMGFNRLAGRYTVQHLQRLIIGFRSFSFSGVSGNLPANMDSSLPKFEFLYLSGNKMDGRIPSMNEKCYKLIICL